MQALTGWPICGERMRERERKRQRLALSSGCVNRCPLLNHRHSESSIAPCRCSVSKKLYVSVTLSGAQRSRRVSSLDNVRFLDSPRLRSGQAAALATKKLLRNLTACGKKVPCGRETRFFATLRMTGLGTVSCPLNGTDGAMEYSE